ncbi:hypothetical protein ACN47E_004244 [Coniothyrium glycines]
MTLTLLPTELIEFIAYFLDLESLRSIRLASSTLQRQTAHPFKERCFRQQHLEWTTDSFARLLDVAQHASFGCALQTLVIDATPQHSINIWQLRKRLSEAQAVVSESSPSFATQALGEQHMNECKDAEHVATYFNESRHDRKCLETVFRLLGSIQQIIFEYEGMDKKYSKFGRRYCESSQHEMSRPFVSVMAAIASSNVHVKAITIHENKNHGAISIGRLESLAPYLRKFDITLANLVTLQLDLRDWRYPDSGFELDSNRAPFVVRFLAKARNIRNLDLSCYSSLENDLFGEMARNCTFSNLETCRLSLFRLNQASDLIAFLGHSSTNLRVLTLSQFRMMDEQVTWANLFRTLAEDGDMLTALETLHLQDLFTQSGSRVIMGDTHWRMTIYTEMAIRGEDWRSRVLDLIHDFMEGGSGPAWHQAAVAYPFIA